MELRMYSYRIYPSNIERTRIINSFKTCKEIYNHLIELNNATYKATGKGMRKFDYNKELTGKYPEIYSQVKQNVSDRVAKAYQNFFRRVKEHAKDKGYPRFKSKVNSITYPQSGFKLLSNKKLRLSKIGSIPIKLHRIPKGKIKTLTIKQNRAGQWHAIFACEIEPIQIKHQSKLRVGIDMGIESLAVTSNGEFISNPRFLIKSEEKLKLLHKRLSRKQKGSRNRGKARHLLARQYLKVSNQRTDFLHKLSHSLTTKYSLIAIENLEVKNMVKNHTLAKHINDASWNTLNRMLSYKAVTCGGQLIKINPRNTTKTCNKCGAIREMPLSERQFLCTNCGYSNHRDLNASINILKVGLDEPELNACGHDIRPPAREAIVSETGTTLDNT